MTKSLGAAPLNGFPDRGQSERFASVDGGVKVFALHVLKRIEVAGGWVARFGAGNVETDHALIAPSHCKLGDLE